MSDVEITLFFNKHRLNRLNAILSEKGSNTEQVLLDALKHIYEQTVPENERRDIEKLIQREVQEEAERIFSISARSTTTIFVIKLVGTRLIALPITLENISP